VPDRAALRHRPRPAAHRAEPQADGSYKITGTKIFISAGEHDLSENIVHLVLARMPDAPPGTKGISLFIVPKFLPTPTARPARATRSRCGSLEHKMGIHGNATCVMNLDGATGWMVGRAEQGPECDVRDDERRAPRRRHAVARAGRGRLPELARLREGAHAGRALTGPKAPDKPADPIIVHPDVRRMLLTQKAYVEGGRAFTYWAGLAIDFEHKHPDPEVRQDNATWCRC
jgi:alkylation response protein AidB-like acyl-CoA dehydrogenase